MSDNRERLFDEWAGQYDKAVRTCEGFPFAGYDAVLKEIIRQADPMPGYHILDLGVGPGTLAHLFESLECEVWGVDFSAEMLSRAASRCPSAHLLQADLLETWPEQLPGRFDCIVSAYVFHEFELADKCLLIERSLRRLVPGGRLIIGDIAFATVRDRFKAREKWKNIWDPGEFYWAADETELALEPENVTVGFQQASDCGGVFNIRKKGATI